MEAGPDPMVQINGPRPPHTGHLIPAVSQTQEKFLS